MSETIDHPEIGLLHWEQEWGWWFTQIESPVDGGWLDVIVDPGDGDRLAFLERAGDLFRWAMENQGRILREAVESELLELYNGAWRQDDEPELTTNQLLERLEWAFLKIRESECVPVTFGYADQNDLFGGHSVDVKVNRELRFRDCNLA